MKTFKTPITLLGILSATLILSACGQTSRGVSSSSASSGSSTIPTSTNTSTFTDSWTWTDTNTTTTTNTQTNTGTNPALSYEFSVLGSQVIQTPAIRTDNVLKLRFRITGDQGNNVWKASELRVTIAVNGVEVTPTYTTNNYVYGRVGEISNVIDLSSYVTPGQPVTITIKNPMNDFYCTYWGGQNADGSLVNPQFNSYPGCRKAVFSNHKWSGVLLVQTSNTVAI